MKHYPETEQMPNAFAFDADKSIFVKCHNAKLGVVHQKIYWDDILAVVDNKETHTATVMMTATALADSNDSLVTLATFSEVASVLPPTLVKIGTDTILNLTKVRAIQNRTLYTSSRTFCVDKSLHASVAALFRSISKKSQTATIETAEAPIALNPFIFTGKYNEVVVMNRLMYIDTDRNYCELHMDGRKNLLTLVPLYQVLTYLPSDKFIQVSRSAVVNIHYVDKINAHAIWIGDHKFSIPRDHSHTLHSLFRLMQRNSHKG